LPNGTVRKGKWEGKTRKEWLEITPEQQEFFKNKLAQSLERAKEVEQQRRSATNEVEEIIKGQDLQAQKHIEEQLPESDQIIEQIEQAAEEQQEVQQQQVEEIIVDEGNQDQGAPF
jgi:hypothetical protein